MKWTKGRLIALGIVAAVVTIAMFAAPEVLMEVVRYVTGNG